MRHLQSEGPLGAWGLPFSTCRSARTAFLNSLAIKLRFGSRTFCGHVVYESIYSECSLFICIVLDTNGVGGEIKKKIEAIKTQIKEKEVFSKLMM